MRTVLLTILACPQCHSRLRLVGESGTDTEEVETGSLECTGCPQCYPIEAGIPRFVPRENYAASFGFQWNQFRAEQIDSVNGTNLSAQRFYAETAWSPEELRGQWVLDAGCGAGRFLDVVSQNDCQVIGLDLSNAVEAAQRTLADRPNVHFVQASIFDLPFASGVLDRCYCIGVIQHTPDPPRALTALPRVLKPGGRLAVTLYERRRWTMWYSKYLIRKLTAGMQQQVLLPWVKNGVTLLFPLTEVLFRLPWLGKLFAFLIPVANYVDEPQLSFQQRYRWALLDTFDMLAPRFDLPQTQAETEQPLAAAGMHELQRLPNPGVNLVGRKGGREPN